MTPTHLRSFAHRFFLLLAVHASAQTPSAMPPMPGMPSMSTPAPQSPGKPQGAPDLRAPGYANGSAATAQQLDHAVSSASNGLSFTYDSLHTQELENLEGHTGSDALPVPELLREFGTRPAMTLEQFLDLAQHNNPTLAQAQSLVEQTRQQARQVSLPPNPMIGYSGEHIRGGQYGGGEQGAYFSQQFVLGGKLGLRRDIYRAETSSNTLGVDEQLARVRNDVGQQFVRTLTAQAAVVLRQRLLKVALDASQTAHQLANLGQADAPDVLTAELEAERAKVDFVHAQRAFLAAFGRLSAEAGAHDLSLTPLSGDLEQPPTLDAEAQVAIILAQSPTVKRAEAEVKVAEARLKDARRESVPDLTVKAGEWYSGDRLNGAGPSVSGGKPAGFMSFVDAGINLPLWNRNQGNVATANVQLDRARKEVARTGLALKRDALPLAQTYLAAHFEADRYRSDLLPRARRAYQLYVMKYQQMAQPYLPALSAQRMLFDLQMNYLEALQSEWTCAIALQNYTLSNGLMSPLNAASGSDSTTLNLPTGGSQ